jgi:hypothetical protein
MIFFKETTRISISGNVKKGPRLINVALEVLEQNKANRLAKNPDRFSQDKLFGKFQTSSTGPGSIGKKEKKRNYYLNSALASNMSQIKKNEGTL